MFGLSKPDAKKESNYLVLIPPIFEQEGDMKIATTPWLIDAVYPSLEEARRYAAACNGIIVRVKVVK